jgi:uncharacterized protein with FMN-binding domain
MKRLLSLLLCLIMVLMTAAGCTQPSQTQPPSAEETGEPDETPKALMKPGTYTAEAYGFSMSWPDILHVTVSENSIESIAFDEESGSTSSMIDAVAAVMFPRILESQSVNVDMISGATVTSSAARKAVEDCIKQAIVAAGNEESAIDAFKKAPEKPGGSQVLETQVLVIGMGGSGTYTALRAAEMGAQVLAIEKQGRYGGTTALTSEVQSINPPRVKELYNKGEDFTDAEAMYKAWMEYTEGDAKKEMLDLYFEYSGLAFDWLAIDHGVKFDFDPKPGFTPADWYKVKFQWYPNSHPDFPGAPMLGINKRDIASYFDNLIEEFTDLGGKYMLETEAYELLTDESGAVVGAKAKNRVTGTEYTIKADAVVVTGIGHETDRTLTDYVADVYCHTPTAAAERIIRGYKDVEEKLTNLIFALKTGTSNVISTKKADLLSTKYILRSSLPLEDIYRAENMLKEHKNLIRNAAEKYINEYYIKIKIMGEKLTSYDYEKQLKRGFALVTDRAGNLVKIKNQVQAKDILQIRFADFKIEAETMDIKEV